jgi:hypothetical protein
MPEITSALPLKREIHASNHYAYRCASTPKITPTTPTREAGDTRLLGVILGVDAQRALPKASLLGVIARFAGRRGRCERRRPGTCAGR